MNIDHYVEEKPFLDYDKWFFGTMFSIALGDLLTLIVVPFFHVSIFVGGVVLWLTTTLFSYWAQRLVIPATLRERMSHLLVWLFGSSAIGWTISLLLVYPLIPMSDPSLWRGFFAGGAIGLSPGVFTSIAYYWLTRPYKDAMYLSIINMIGWCLGTGLAATVILGLLTLIVKNMPIF